MNLDDKLKLTIQDIIEIIANGFSIIPKEFIQLAEYGDPDYLRGLHVDDGEKKIYINTKQSASEIRETILHELYHGKLRLERLEQDEKLVNKLTKKHYRELYKWK